MDIEQRIKALAKLGKELNLLAENWNAVIARAAAHNPWFSIESSKHALRAIAQKFLSEEKLHVWIQQYDQHLFNKNKVIGIVTAGNIPMVGLHDILCVLITGNTCQLKLSDKDSILMEYFLERLIEIEPGFKEQVQFKSKLENFDAIICTGSNNTARFFEHYFGKYKHIIRKNRNSVAVLSGNESNEELEQLGADVFTHFGMGCRNVSKIFVPKDFDLQKLKPAWDLPYGDVMLHHKYKSNLDYQRTVYLMNQVPMLDIDFINIVENPNLASPLACLYYERYEKAEEVHNKLKERSGEIQCIVGHGYLPFGQTQQPELWDYADGVDTMDFILHL